jgi:pimeloyl-ACP methyl ester carboxylesterase
MFMRHLDASQVCAEDRAAYLDEWGQHGAMTAMLNWYRASTMIVPAVCETPERPAFLDAPFPVLMTPALVVWGMKDKALLQCQIDGLSDFVADLTLIKVEAGHFIPWQVADVVSTEIARWLGKL